MTSSSTVRILLGCDGFGEDLKNAVKDHLESKENIVVDDLGSDTYFDAAGNVAKQVSKSGGGDQEVMGILFCGTGMGVGIVANKFPGVRAATCENIAAAKCARAVNNANILCLGKLVTPPDEAKKIVDSFLEQKFISQPGESATWWNSDVEAFLQTSMEGIERVEKDAAEAAKS